MTVHDQEAQAQWTKWLSLGDLAPTLAEGTQQNYEGLCLTLLHLAELNLLQWGRDEHGALWFRVRMDEVARTLALRDDQASCETLH